MAKKEAATEVRIDKWLWAVRLFKTRSLATEACKKGKIMMLGNTVKPSRNIKVDDVIQIKKPPIVFSFKVLALTENRMGAKLTPEFIENVTPQDQLDLLEMRQSSAYGLRDKGIGRPTKKERRDIDAFTDVPFFVDEFDFEEE